ncbi:ABC transporter permease [Pedosphaera parvula]|uniref:Uncharacterized protein n=1 Tax=Pedosphaera parvula (strain Ellin514) TaxID=320771 RepID=B9XLQ3_PEDPL|nr:ABC transporter permease [Pedosphaera parvula]EEF59301.1 hypothetical protein Cflav_PD2152 [Pedosphaera parvula Ellin514]
MNPLITKEIRLLLPGYITALLLAVFSAWLSSWEASVEDIPIAMILAPLLVGTLLLALSSFGREFGMSTFSLLMSQPLTRSRIWWTKVTVLALAMATIFGACILSSIFWQHTHLDEIGGALNLAIAFLVILSSALWTTLFFRQIIAALWFALLIPMAIWTAMSWFGASTITTIITFLSYSMVSLWWAWYQFHRTQEVAWTGGNMALPEWKAANTASEPVGRSYHPIGALFLKELKLHQVALMGMAGLFILHLGAIAVRKVAHNASDYSLLKGTLESFPAFWILVPLLTASLTVADERRLGTMEGNLCLPVSTRVQFSIKLFFALVLGGLLSALLLWIAEAIGVLVGAGGWFGGISLSFHGSGLGSICILFVAVALISFYASTLTRNLIQAVAAAAITILVLGSIFRFAAALPYPLGLRLWDDLLLILIATPTLIIVLIWLAHTNFQHLAEARRLWSRNLCTLFLSMLGIATVTTALYHRAWEYLGPLERAHGPALLSISQPPILDTAFYGTSVLLPDGRLWRDHIVYDPGRPLFMIKDTPWFGLGGQWLGSKGDRFLNGSNWMAQASRYWVSAAIQSNGTLWVSERRSPAAEWKTNYHPSPLPPADLVRFGDDTNWKDVVHGPGHEDMVLLKTDGTLWRWGNNGSTKKGLIEVTPHQLDSDSDWTHILSAGSDLFAWKKSGEAWKITNVRPNTPEPLLDHELVAVRWKVFDNMEWRSLANYQFLQFAVRNDGTLWGYTTIGKTGRKRNSITLISQPKLVKIGEVSDWVSVATSYEMMVALKSDGSLWKWDLHTSLLDLDNPHILELPARLGSHHDWVALAASHSSIVTLAADGTLWDWWNTGSSPSLFAPSRKPTRMANIFDQ